MNALRSGVNVLRRIATYEIDPTLDQLLLELGERKEFLSRDQHDLLLMLVRFTEQRAVEKLEAALALEDLARVFPEFESTRT